MMKKKLRDEGFEIGRERTRKLMKALNLKVKHKRKYKVTTDSQHKLAVAENVLDRQFNPTGPNQVWGTDITYLWTHEGWIYLAVVIDLYSRRVVGWSIDRRMNKALVIRSLMMAINLRRPPPGLLHHSSGQPVCQPCVPETAETAWHDSEHESQRQLLGQCSGRTVLQRLEARMDW